jgi:DNA-binding response OmpR family regulator
MMATGDERASGEGGESMPRTKRVLIVEDMLLIALEMQRRLHEAGYEVVGPAATPAQALRLAREGRLDCALLDIDLNGQMATEVIEELRRQDVPLFLTTGYGVDMLPESYRDCPCFTKPIVAAELTKALDEALSARGV